MAQCEGGDLDRLVALMMEWDSEIVVPGQWLTNLMAMIPKKKGHRTVATMASGYRTYTSLEADEDRRWSINASHEDNSSQANTSCLWAVEERLIEQEILTVEGTRH